MAQLKAQGPAGCVELAEVEVALLCALVRAPEQRLARWQLLEVLRSDLDGASQANLAVRMTRLRKKLSDTGFDGPTLQVIRHEGYQLRVPVQLVYATDAGLRRPQAGLAGKSRAVPPAPCCAHIRSSSVSKSST
jgi:DNA-binding winged helix-turn-helix (wHTH) protein